MPPTRLAGERLRPLGHLSLGSRPGRAGDHPPEVIDSTTNYLIVRRGAKCTRGAPDSRPGRPRRGSRRPGCGGSGIRTHEARYAPTRFPGVRTRPDYAIPPGRPILGGCREAPGSRRARLTSVVEPSDTSRRPVAPQPPNQQPATSNQQPATRTRLRRRPCYAGR